MSDSNSPSPQDQDLEPVQSETPAVYSEEPKASFFERLLEKFSNSREFTISVILHVILVTMFGTAVLFEAVQEPPDFEGGSGGSFVQSSDAPSAPPQPQQTTQTETTFEVTTSPTVAPTNPINAITTTGSNALNFEMAAMIMPTTTTAPVTGAPSVVAPSAPAPSQGMGRDGMTAEIQQGIAGFAGGWSRGSGRGAGSGTGLRQREFEFFAFIGQYSGGNWNSTVQVQGNQVTGGSLPNLLWIMNEWSRDRIKTNDKNVRVIRLDSDELFSVKPPFIFMTGTRDFRLTEREVENLRKYVRLGGCIWGDSSLPGRNSRFDIAFRREMRRVIPDVDKDFVPLPNSHPIFTSNYFPEIKDVPAGVNFYQEPVYALHMYGEIGILYTANDYGNMMQVGIEENGKVDLRRNERNQYVAVNPMIWDNRFTYLGNITPVAGRGSGAKPDQAQNLIDVYKFGTNIVVHLLTRWDRIIASAPTL